MNPCLQDGWRGWSYPLCRALEGVGATPFVCRKLNPADRAGWLAHRSRARSGLRQSGPGNGVRGVPLALARFPVQRDSGGCLQDKVKDTLDRSYLVGWFCRWSICVYLLVVIALSLAAFHINAREEFTPILQVTGKRPYRLLLQWLCAMKIGWFLHFVN